MSAMLLLFDGGFNPRSLFAAGEQGAWYDPSDFSTLFQDAAGTTPVTAVGQYVGLMLDKRLGMALGAEKSAYSGGFSSTAGISSIGVTSTIAGTELVVASTSSDGSDRAEIPVSGLTVGATYRATIIARRGAQGTNQFVQQWTVGTIPSTAVTSTSSSTISFLFVATTSSGVARVYSQATGGAIGDSLIVSSLSIREIAGNHAYQTTLAARQTAQSNYLSLDKTDDHLLVAAGGAGTTGFLLVAGIMVPAAGTARTLWSDRGTNAGYKVGIDASNQIVFSAGNGAGFVTATGPALVAGMKYVITAWHDGANLNISVNNGTPTQAAFVTATAGTATFTIGKSNGAATEYWGDRIYGMIYRKNDASNAGQRNQAYSYIVGKMGGL